MANSARIDELEKKFSENARRYFAPLANEYRKAGDLDRAIEICRAHLPQQPGHMSGHVVYGQALYESRQLDEAKTVFEAALALDPENLIALRHLGDIARDSADPGTARIWYLRVLDADPRNDEVAGMLAELDAAGPPAAAPAPASGESSSVGWGEINPERPSSGAAAPGSPRKDAPTEATTEESADVPTGGPSLARDAKPAAAEPARSSEAALLPDAPAPPPGSSLDRMLNEAFAAEADTLEIEPFAPKRAQAPDARAGDAPPRDLDDETFAEVDALFDEISPPRATGNQRAVTGSQPTQPAPGRSVPAAPADATTGDALFGDDATREAASAESGTAIPGLETAEFISPSRDAGAGSSRRNTGSAVTGLTSFVQPTNEDSSTRAAFVTETMAELYLQQGFMAEALEIYRQLLAQNPDDASLQDRIDQLERGGGTSLSVAAVSSEVIEAAKQRHASRPVRTVRWFFGRLAGRRAPERSAGADQSNGEQSEAATGESGFEPAGAGEGVAVPIPVRFDIVSSLFGDAQVSDADEQAASTLASGFSSAMLGQAWRPAEAPTDQQPSSGGGQGGRAAHAAGAELSLDQVFRESASRNPRKSGAFSFDQFFSDGSPGGASGSPAGESTAADSSEGPEGDLEQFTAWLEGLKRK